MRRLRDRAGRDLGAAPQDRDAVGDAEHLIHVVTDQQDGGATLPELQDQFFHLGVSATPRAAVGSSISTRLDAQCVARAMATAWR